MQEQINWQQTKQNEGIAGDRREDRRYQIHLDLRWKLVRRRKVIYSGDGATLDISSGGLLIDTGRTLPSGLSIELAIAWPVLLNDENPMQLAITGRIVRCIGHKVAIKIIQHEFRTDPQAAPGTLAGPMLMRKRFVQ